MNHSEKKDIVEYFSKSIKCKSASFFIGSGLSIGAGYPTWADILNDCASEINLDAKKEKKDLINLAQYYFNDKKRTKINEIIKDSFSNKKANITETHKLIAALPLDDIWTTNYDTLLERSFEHYGTENTVITDDSSYRDIDRYAKVKIFKMHGTVEKASECIITRDDYENYPKHHDIVLAQLKSELCFKSFLFLGYSFSDTDIRFVFEQIRKCYDEDNPQRHYCIMKSLDKKDYLNRDADYLYDNNKVRHFINDMKRYGVNILLIDNFSEIDDLLIDIRNKVYESNVLITGAYSEGNKEAESIKSIAEKISFELINHNFVVYSGYGKNLGSDIVNGVFDACTKIDGKKFEDVVKLTPFPYKQRNTEYRKKLYSQIRKKMISKTRVNVIISGENDGVSTNGTIEEYKLAYEQNNLIIPIKCTGGAAEDIWNELSTDDFYKNNDSFIALKEAASPESIANIVIKMIEDWKAE